MGGHVLSPTTRFSLADDGLQIMPAALSAAELESMNAYVDRALERLENNTQLMTPAMLTKVGRLVRKAGRGAYGSASNAQFCWGDITTRDPGKYEVRQLSTSRPSPPNPALCWLAFSRPGMIVRYASRSWICFRGEAGRGHCRNPSSIRPRGGQQ